MSSISSKSDQTKKVGELHLDCKRWKSGLGFIQDEILFIERLLNSYVFEPNTPNLFERLQDYLSRLKKASIIKNQIYRSILNHENDLGGMLECRENACDLGLYQKHNLLKAEITDFTEGFQSLKAEIFNYAGGILKKRKSNR